MVYIKLQYNNRCKKILLPKENISYSEISEILKKSFGLVESEKIHLTYKDIQDNNDEITVDNQDDLEVAFQSLIQEQIIKFFVFYSGSVKSGPDNAIQKDQIKRQSIIKEKQKQNQEQQQQQQQQLQLSRKSSNELVILKRKKSSKEITNNEEQTQEEQQEFDEFQRKQESYFQKNKNNRKKFSLVLSEDGDQEENNNRFNSQSKIESNSNIRSRENSQTQIKYVDKEELQDIFQKATSGVFKEINESVKEMVQNSNIKNGKLPPILSNNINEIQEELKEGEENNSQNDYEYQMELNIKKCTDIVVQKLLEGIENTSMKNDSKISEKSVEKEKLETKLGQNRLENVEISSSIYNKNFQQQQEDVTLRPIEEEQQQQQQQFEENFENFTNFQQSTNLLEQSMRKLGLWDDNKKNNNNEDNNNINNFSGQKSFMKEQEEISNFLKDHDDFLIQQNNNCILKVSKIGHNQQLSEITESKQSSQCNTLTNLDQNNNDDILEIVKPVKIIKSENQLQSKKHSLKNSLNSSQQPSQNHLNDDNVEDLNFDFEDGNSSNKKNNNNNNLKIDTLKQENDDEEISSEEGGYYEDFYSPLALKLTKKISTR